MRRLALDVDALVHARRPGLVPEIEALISLLPDRAYIERSVYHRDAARSGLLPLLEDWRERALLQELVDYRRLPDGDRQFRRLGATREWKGLSPQDRATLVMATTLRDCGVLTCERLPAAAARDLGASAMDPSTSCASGSEPGASPSTERERSAPSGTAAASARGGPSMTAAASSESWPSANSAARCRSELLADQPRTDGHRMQHVDRPPHVEASS